MVVVVSDRIICIREHIVPCDKISAMACVKAIFQCSRIAADKSYHVTTYSTKPIQQTMQTSLKCFSVSVLCHATGTHATEPCDSLNCSRRQDPSILLGEVWAKAESRAMKATIGEILSEIFVPLSEYTIMRVRLKQQSVIGIRSDLDYLHSCS